MVELIKGRIGELQQHAYSGLEVQEYQPCSGKCGCCWVWTHKFHYQLREPLHLPMHWDRSTLLSSICFPLLSQSIHTPPKTSRNTTVLGHLDMILVVHIIRMYVCIPVRFPSIHIYIYIYTYVHYIHTYTYLHTEMCNHTYCGRFSHGVPFLSGIGK